MGADFLLTAVPTTDPAVARERLDQLSNDQVMDACEAVLGWGVHEDDIDIVPNHSDDCRERIRYAIDAVLAGHEPRDTGILYIDHKTYIVTGGMSYGDYPTDSFEDVALLDYSGICDDDYRSRL